MKTIEDKLKYLLSVNPKLSENNTEVCLALWEYVAEARGIDKNDWFEMKLIIRAYPPETITRARRELTESTREQRDKEEEMHEKYAHNHL